MDPVAARGPRAGLEPAGVQGDALAHPGEAVAAAVGAGRRDADEVVGFVGLNGAGKTTTMRVVLGLLEPDAGEVRWASWPLTQQVLLQLALFVAVGLSAFALADRFPIPPGVWPLAVFGVGAFAVVGAVVCPFLAPLTYPWVAG